MSDITHAGGIILNSKNEVLLVLNNLGYWTFPRGHVKKDEDLLSAAKREIKEETGVGEMELIRDLGNYERKRLNEEKLMRSQMYLFRTSQMKINSEDPQIKKVKWFSKDQVGNTLTAEGDKNFYSLIIPSI